MKRLVLTVSLALSLRATVAMAENNPQPSSGEYVETVASAQEFYGKKEFTRATALFVRAAFLAENDADRSILLFNAAVAAFEGKSYEEAERRFLEAATLDPKTHDACLLEAALVALERGSLESAEAHRARVDERDESTLAKREEVDRAIASRRSSEAKTRIERSLDRAETSYKAGKREETRAHLDRFEADRAFATPAQLDFADLLVAYLAHDAGNLEEARRVYELLLARNGNHVDARLGFGDLLAEERRPNEALEQYRLAKSSATTRADQERSNRRIYEIYPLSPERFLVTARVDLGYDSNAAQSGSASRTGFAAVGRTESPFLALSLALERPFRFGERDSLSPFYLGNATFLGDSRVRDYSIQGHEAGLLYHHAFTPSMWMRLGTSADLYLVGLESQSPFLSELWLGGQFLFDHGRHFSLRVGAHVRREFGLSGRNSLSGVRSDLEIRETFHFGTFHPFVVTTATSNDIGTQVVPLRDLSLALCGGPPPPSGGPICDEGAEYHIPLGYGALALGTGFDFDPLPTLRFSLSMKLEGRKYSASSFILRDPGGPAPPGPERLNEKIRTDLRAEVRATLLYKLDRSGTFSIPLDLWGLASGSNIAQSAIDPEHTLDYDNRRFTQFVVTLGFRYAN